MSKTLIENKTYDEERALYNLCDAEVKDCEFSGPADGESALKEARDIDVKNCRFLLRYPLWHVESYRMDGCFMDITARAALWYAKNGVIENSTLGGIKCLRECDDTLLRGCKVNSAEFGWKCRGLTIRDCDMESEYYLFGSRDIEIDDLRMKGKYSFQYTENLTVENSVLDTKDAFWHSKNATVKNSVVKGEYLAWYSEGLTLENCKIIGTQPLCYCKNLTLINCTMEETDLAFEYSEVQADIKGSVLSVKNPKSGRITADGYGEIILGDAVMETGCEIITR